MISEQNQFKDYQTEDVTAKVQTISHNTTSIDSNENVNNNNNNNDNQLKVNNNGITKKKAASGQNFDQSDLFKCRLCHLTLNNQRALHEHVARIHGGKGGMFNSSLFANNMLDDYDNDDGFDYEDETDTDKSLQASTLNFKKKFTSKHSAHPNVAIR